MDQRELQPAIITNNVKILMTFIDRVGFPVLAFLLMFWLNLQLGKLLVKVNENLATIQEVMRDVKAELSARRINR